jgi:hypothetical protein
VFRSNSAPGYFVVNRAMRQVGFALRLCCLLYIVSAVVADGANGNSHLAHGSSATGLVVFGSPAVAAVVLFLLAISFPDLTVPHRVAFPLNLTLPSLFCGLAFTVVKLITGAGAGIQSTPDALLPALVWLDWRYLALTWGGQVGILSLGVLLRRREDRVSAARR